MAGASKRGAAQQADQPPAKRVSAKSPPVPPKPMPEILDKLQKHFEDPRMQSFLKAIPPTAVAMGGIEEFDLDGYKAAMKVCKSYTCVLPAHAIEPLSTSHQSIVPSDAQIHKCQEAYWSTSNPRADFEGQVLIK